MRLIVTCAIMVLALGAAATSARAQCEDKSQQNAADEAVAKGDLNAASRCATQDDAARSEKKLENAAEKAKGSQDLRSDPANVDGPRRDGDQKR